VRQNTIPSLFQRVSAIVMELLATAMDACRWAAWGAEQKRPENRTLGPAMFLDD
jgi:hypothetical protein